VLSKDTSYQTKLDNREIGDESDENEWANFRWFRFYGGGGSWQKGATAVYESLKMLQFLKKVESGNSVKFPITTSTCCR
jgi:hypothetical protein